MANFDVYLPFLLEAEGGFVNDPADPGGATNKGVTLATLRECARELLGVEPTLANLMALTDREASVIYKRRYWDALGADAIPDQRLAESLVDFYVNAGCHAIIALQQTLNDGDPALALVVDGVFGPTTSRSMLSTTDPQLATRLCARRIAYYTTLAARSPALDKFLAGWIGRTNALAQRWTA